jgi:hypothetical protein
MVEGATTKCRLKQHNSAWRLNMKFNRSSRTALLSVILGDGHLGKTGSGSILHCAAQKDYLLWKIAYLRSEGVKCSDITYKNNNGFDSYRTYISTTKWGKTLRRILYKDGYKNIYNRKLLNRLSAIHIAIWYMDDGGLAQKKRNGVVHANELILNTHTTKSNNQVLIDYFDEVWGISFSQVLNRGRYRLRCGTKEARKFLAIVREYVSQVPSMAHKLNVKS